MSSLTVQQNPHSSDLCSFLLAISISNYIYTAWICEWTVIHNLVVCSPISHELLGTGLQNLVSLFQNLLFGPVNHRWNISRVRFIWFYPYGNDKIEYHNSRWRARHGKTRIKDLAVEYSMAWWPLFFPPISGLVRSAAGAPLHRLRLVMKALSWKINEIWDTRKLDLQDFVFTKEAQWLVNDNVRRVN